MPISIEEFETAAVEDLKVNQTPFEEDPLVEFFSNHSHQAFTLRELVSQTGLPILELAARLNHLANKDVVRNRGSYWAISPDYTDS